MTEQTPQEQLNAILATMSKRNEELKKRSINDTMRLEAIFLWLRTQDPRLERIEIQYDGSGDSGTIENISFYGKTYDQAVSEELNKLQDLEIPKELQELRVIGKQYKGNEWVDVYGPANVEIRQVLDDLGWDIPYANHPGFEINEGGFGTLTVRMANEHDELEDPSKTVILELEHSDRYIETNVTSLTL